MSLTDLLSSLAATPLAAAIAESGWIFPTLECFHVIAITLVVGSILAVDLRLLGLASRSRPADVFTAQLTPITWSAFSIALLTGGLMFLAKPLAYSQNLFFRGKLALLVLAAVNMAVFHLVVERRAGGPAPGLAAKASGLASLVIWVTIIALGRWIGFTVP
jgi:hypothetical protein